MTKIYKAVEKVNGLPVQVYKNDGQAYMSFIDTGLKFDGQKVYEGYMFLQDSDRLFKGYYFKANTIQLFNTRVKGLHEKVTGKHFANFSKDIKLSWSQWFDFMSNDKDVCTGKTKLMAV